MKVLLVALLFLLLPAWSESDEQIKKMTDNYVDVYYSIFPVLNGGKSDHLADQEIFQDGIPLHVMWLL